MTKTDIAPPADGLPPRDPSACRTRLAVLGPLHEGCALSAHTACMVDGLDAAVRTHGVDVDVLVLAEAVERGPCMERPQVHRCWNRQDLDVARLLDLLARERVKVLHVQFDGERFRGTDLPRLLWACRKQGIRVFGSFHFMEPLAELAAEAINQMDRAFVHLEPGALRFIAVGAEPSRVRVVPLGPSGNRAATTPAQARQALGLPGDLELVTSHGHFEPDEGIVEILRALPAVVSRHPQVQFAFLRASHPGAPANREYLRECRELALDLGLENHVAFGEGCLPDEAAGLYLAASDVVILNYAPPRPAAGAAAARVLAHGRPLLTSAAPAFLALPDHVLLPVGDGALAMELNRVLENPKLAARLEDGARAFMEAEFYRRLGGLLLAEYGLLVCDEVARAA